MEVSEILNRLKTGELHTITSDKEVQRYTLNTPDGALRGVECSKCGNSGTIFAIKNGVYWAKECDCMKKRRNIKHIRESGLDDLLSRYTFDAFKPIDANAKELKARALEYVENPNSINWFYICGRPGSGKTHLCIAISSAFLELGKEVKYMLWRDVVPELKRAATNYEAYKEIIAKYKNAEVLYIDDFLKGSVTQADVNIAFELLNYRYNNSKLKTIISSELSIEEILNEDEAVGSRIFERSKGFCLTTQSSNMRLQNITKRFVESERRM